MKRLTAKLASSWRRRNDRLTRDHVIWAYRLFLDREPESEEIIRATLAEHSSTRELRCHLMASDEFQSKNPNLGLEQLGESDLPIPPFELIHLVSGSHDLRWFLRGGELAAQSIRATLERQRIDIAGMNAVLDLGCGCGRVLRHFHELADGVLHGCDYNPVLIDWCREHLPGISFEVNDLTPPLAASDGSFDLVYALSVFTHLPEDLQQPWMEELARVVRIGGHLLFTIHGESYLGELTSDERVDFETGRLVVQHSDVAGTNQCGAYHPESYLRSLAASCGFIMIEHIPEGAEGNPHQDVVLFVRR